MAIEKQVFLQDKVTDDNGNVIANVFTTLTGDGSTPTIMATGGVQGVIGYEDNGEPILSKTHDELIEESKKNMMAEAIKEQKALCVENGVDPDLVNIINAEKDVSKQEDNK